VAGAAALVATFFTDLVVLAAAVLIVLIPVELFDRFKRTHESIFCVGMQHPLGLAATRLFFRIENGTR